LKPIHRYPALKAYPFSITFAVPAKQAAGTNTKSQITSVKNTRVLGFGSWIQVLGIWILVLGLSIWFQEFVFEI
jgi:hypothetical protein